MVVGDLESGRPNCILLNGEDENRLSVIGGNEA
jgi:hypothetical protein